MLRRRLLVILASMLVAASSARIEYEKAIEDDWAEHKPFQMIMSWYLKHAYAVTVQVIHREKWDSMYHHSARLLPVIHETRNVTVLVTHYVVKTEDHRKSHMLRGQDHHPFNDNSSRIANRAPDAAFSKSRARQLACNRKYRNQSRPVTTNLHWLTILLIPDEAAFHTFLESGGFLWRSQVKFMLIIVVPESEDVLCQGKPDAREWKQSARNILERVWTEDKVLNIFLSAPTSGCIKDYLFAWNPFATTSANKSSGALKRLKVNAKDPTADEALSEFTISLKNMNGYPLKVTVFERLPTLLASLDEDLHHDSRPLDIDKITGVDGLVLRTLISRMNCSAELQPPNDGQMYGWKMRNGTFVGMLGDIVYRKADFAANGVFLKDYETATATEFTVPISCDSICIVVPRAGMIPQWLQIFQCFSPMVWSLLFFIVVIYGLLRHVLRSLLPDRRPRRNLFETVLETALIFVSSPENMPRLYSERILMGFYLLFNVIVIGTFQGTLYEGFTSPDYYNNLNTLDELDDSGLLIATGSPNLLNIFGVEDDVLTLSHLRKKIQFSQASWESGAIDRAASEGDIAAIERRNDLKLSIHTKFLDEHGEPVLHIVDECPRTYHLAFIVPSGAFFLRRANVLLRRMVESGLVFHWYNSTVDLLILKSQYAMAKKLAKKDKIPPFNLKNLQISFMVLISGLLLSILVFIAEKIVARRNRARRRPILRITIATRNFAL